jgi:hypothetical protein
VVGMVGMPTDDAGQLRDGKPGDLVEVTAEGDGYQENAPEWAKRALVA